MNSAREDISAIAEKAWERTSSPDPSVVEEAEHTIIQATIAMALVDISERLGE